MLMRSDPFREFDRLTDQLSGNARLPVMPMDAYKQGDEFLVHFDLPGVESSSIDLTVEKNVLTVSAERAWQRENGIDVIAAERPQGKFSRQLFLGDGLDVDHVEAGYDNGVLTIRIPVADQAKPRRVEVSSGGDAKQIEASTA
ncbi:MAG: Hsp20/alpha crystallin family protein [Actinobacteria bacterium]|nr:MAG: Hsp20/alpha crystallin family protein [Actinomycetota bacterium]